MREHQISTKARRFKIPKELSKNRLFVMYGSAIILFLFALLTKNHILLFLFVTAVSATINYQTNIMTIRVNPDPEVFASLLLTRVMGLHYGFAMLLIPTLFVDIYTARLDVDTFVSLILSLVINYLMWIIPLDFVLLAVILVTAKFIVGLMINLAMDVSPPEIFFEHIVGFVTNILMFLSFGNILLKIFSG